ncbi:MAG TPA: N-acetylmuramoyl-L-alanine amidase-like domain-containing protein [Rhodothermales bacterium]|nr:N-acetylmuramoyl-L-alanine amidase-like domain-containing protein [Rhodothermales bacterium]
MRPILTLACCLTLLSACRSDVQQVSTPVRNASFQAPDRPSSVPQVFTDIMAFARAQKLQDRPLGEVMQTVGEQLKGTPYVAGTLDLPGQEKLVCRMDGFDCVTFYETALAMARGIEAQDYSFDTFKRNLLDGRYRDGKLDGYCSRLHYFSDWVADNQARGNVENVTADLGGVPLDKTLDFMTTHRDLYPRFATNDQTYACIADMEQDLAGMDLYYIPTARIRSAYGKLQAGDIVGMATSINGLDVTHTGLVYDDGTGGKGFLHASTSGGVKVSPDLQAYAQNNKSTIGIIIVRPKL